MSTVKARQAPPGTISKRVILEALTITPQALGKWGLRPAGRVGREVFYNLEDFCRIWVEKRGATEIDRNLDDEDRESARQVTQGRLEEEYKLTKARRIAQELKNEEKEGRLISTDFATFALSRIAAQIATILDTLPLSMRRAHPDLEPRHIDALTREIAKARNTAAQVDELLPELVEEYVETLSETD
ncbi:DNA-packaging protein [Spongiibacter sp. KMU-166]|uniref:DNA-packaging protein n=1 Tax=Spongiibacter thalassae TaxID=2721624 RepID=A0ABX1GGC3_9GAMM|nr:terminase small subunit [Spongiibacter thalassae]NKI17427.1 DNA-packaging protein [Spongiibacter thalassae]